MHGRDNLKARALHLQCQMKYTQFISMISLKRSCRISFWRQQRVWTHVRRQSCSGVFSFGGGRDPLGE